MSTRSFLQALSPALQRRIARTPLRRRFPASITSSTTFPQSTRHYASSSADTISSTPLQPVDGEIPAESADSPGLEKERKEQPRQASTSKVDQDELAEKRARPPKSSLAVLLSRLSLDYRQELEETLVICLTHYSFKGSKNAKGSKNVKHNESLASLGNHLLGLFTAEHLSRKFPLMPTEVLKGAVTAYVGPLACRSIARELGVTATSNTGEATALIPVRWANPKPSKRNSGSGLVQSGEQNSEMGEAEELEGQQSEELIVDGADGNEASLEGSERSRRTGRGRPQILDTRTKVIEQTVRAFVGMIFQEKGIHAARDFVHAHFLNRHLDLESLFRINHPRYVLASTVARHLSQAGVDISTGAGRIDSRIIGQSGVNTQAPVFNIGLYLPSGLKIAEGNGASKAMAEHRAAVNGLLALYLVRGDQDEPVMIGTVPYTFSKLLPTSLHVDHPATECGLSPSPRERQYVGNGFGGLDGVVEASKSTFVDGRVPGAKRTNALTGGY